MKRIISAAVVVFMLTAMLSISLVAAPEVPTADDLSGYENVCLTYTFRRSGSDNGRHYENDLLPYTAYLDKNGQIKDFFFDSYLFLPCMDYGPSGARMHFDENNPTKSIDWTAYVDDTFAGGANVDALENAYGTTKKALGDTKSKAGVFFTLLYPGKKAINFGSLGGKSLNFSNTEDRKHAVKWMIDEQISRFEQRGYKNLELVGFYWLEEYIVDQDDAQILRYASDYLHSKGLKFVWIPWYKANGYERWDSFGFDVACMQPNLMWIGYNDPTRVQSSVALSEQYGLSMEMECDGRVYTDEYFSRYLNYLDGGLNSSMMNSVKMYYQDGKTAVYYKACYSQNPQYRTVYDLTYKYAKKTLTQADIDAVRPQQITNDYEIVKDIGRDSLMKDDVDWVSIGKSYTACRSFVDGNGAAYQHVDGKELTDGIIASAPLSTDWHAFHHTLLDSDGRMSVVVDLGEVRKDLTHFYAHFDNRLDYGIGSPVEITLSVSNDGSSFRTLAVPVLIMDATDSCIKHETEPLTARYVKMSFGAGGGNFVFCSEFFVGVKGGNIIDDSSQSQESMPEESGSQEPSEPETSEPHESSPMASVDEKSDKPEESNISISDDKNSDLPDPDTKTPAKEGTDARIWIAVGCAAIIVAAVAAVLIKKKKN